MGNAGAPGYAMYAMVSADGDTWHARSSVPAGADCPGLGENDWTYQSDGATIFAVFRNAGPASTLCVSRSSTEGHVWAVASVLKLPQPNNVLPRVALLSSGLLALSTGYEVCCCSYCFQRMWGFFKRFDLI